MDRVWLSAADVLALHDEALAEFGGLSGMRDAGLLESAVAPPRNLIAYGDSPSLFACAASYCVGLARNHPFLDGNKRTAFLTAAVFLDLNGYLIEPSEQEVVETIVGVAQHEIDEAAAAQWLKRNSRRKKRKP